MKAITMKTTTKTTKTTKNTKTVPTVTKVVIKEPSDKYDYIELLEEHTTKSAVIRILDKEGYSRSSIAKFMNIRYQHVRNVLTTVLKRKV